MSVLVPGDEELHYSDNSHRWLCPDPDGDEAWLERLRTHQADHLAAHRAGRDEPAPRIARPHVPQMRRPT